jgi:hypothetical protein
VSAATCDNCGDRLDGALAHALGRCAECDDAPESGEVAPSRRHHGAIVAACRHRAMVTPCRGALRWSGPASDGEVLCEAHWLVAEGFSYRDALAALGRTCGEG